MKILHHISSKKAIILIAFFGLLVFANVVTGGFLFDDYLLIQNNLFIRSLKNIPDFFIINPTNTAGMINSNFYRPNQYIINTIIYHFFELNVIPYHLVSILLHLLNGFLIFKLFQKLHLSDLTSIILTLLFIVHPINLEAVSYIAGVADPLVLTFMLTGVHIFFTTTIKNYLKFFIQILLTFLLSLCSKEIAVVFPFLLLLILGYQYQTLPKNIILKKVWVLGTSFIILGFYLVLKFTVFNFMDSVGLTENLGVYNDSLYIRLITFLGVLHEYFITLFYPKHLYIERPFLIYINPVHINVIIGALILILGSVISFIHFRKKQLIVPFGFLWFLIAFIPYTGIITLNAAYLEHWFYIPFIGFLITLGYFLDRFKVPKKLLAPSAIIVLILLSIRSIARNEEWKNPEAFYKNELSYSTNNLRMRINLSLVYIAENRHQEAEAILHEALAIDSLSPQALYNLGICYFNQERYQKAEEQFLTVIKNHPNFTFSYVQLYNVYKKTNDPKIDILVVLIDKIARYGATSLTQDDLAPLF